MVSDIDRVILTMIDYLINQAGKKSMPMATFYHRLEGIAFVFTERTTGALGEVM